MATTANTATGALSSPWLQQAPSATTTAAAEATRNGIEFSGGPGRLTSTNRCHSVTPAALVPARPPGPAGGAGRPGPGAGRGRSGPAPGGPPGPRLEGPEHHRLAPIQTVADLGHHPLGLRLGCIRVGRQVDLDHHRLVGRALGLAHHEGARRARWPASGRPDRRVPGLVGPHPPRLGQARRHPERGLAGVIVDGDLRLSGRAGPRGHVQWPREDHLEVSGPPEQAERCTRRQSRSPPTPRTPPGPVGRALELDRPGAPHRAPGVLEWPRPASAGGRAPGRWPGASAAPGRPAWASDGDAVQTTGVARRAGTTGATNPTRRMAPRPTGHRRPGPIPTRSSGRLRPRPPWPPRCRPPGRTTPPGGPARRAIRRAGGRPPGRPRARRSTRPRCPADMATRPTNGPDRHQPGPKSRPAPAPPPRHPAGHADAGGAC